MTTLPNDFPESVLQEDLDSLLDTSCKDVSNDSASFPDADQTPAWMIDTPTSFPEVTAGEIDVPASFPEVDLTTAGMISQPDDSSDNQPFNIPDEVSTFLDEAPGMNR